MMLDTTQSFTNWELLSTLDTAKETEVNDNTLDLKHPLGHPDYGVRCSLDLDGMSLVVDFEKYSHNSCMN